jgi:hypothetical protein
VGDGLAQALHLGDHCLLVGLLDLLHVGRRSKRINDAERGGHADLQAHMLGKVTALLGGLQIKVGGARLPRVTELTEADLVRGHALRQRKQRKLRSRTHRARRVRPQVRARAQQRILKACPQPAAADLAVGNAPQPPAELPADGAENLVHAVETDAAHEMSAVGKICHLPRSLSRLELRPLTSMRAMPFAVPQRPVPPQAPRTGNAGPRSLDL